MTVGGGFSGDIAASAVGDNVLGRTGEGQLVGLARSEVVVIAAARGHQAWRHPDHAIVGGRHQERRLGAALVAGRVEYAEAGIVGRQVQGVGHLQAQLGLVTVVAVGAVGVAHIGWRSALGAAEHVVAIGIARVQQAEDVGFDLFELGADGHAVGVCDPRPARTDRQFTGALHGVVDGGEHALLLQQGIAHRIDVAAVLVQQCLLLLQQQQARCADRVIGRRLDTDTRGDLVVGLVHAREILGVASGAGLVELSSGNTHESLLLTKH
ncbi:hypothetical protein D3C79_761260 [compost metagenome]